MVNVDFSEIQTWTAEEAAGVIRGNLPSGGSLEYALLKEGYYEVVVTIPDKDSLVEHHVDLRLALLNVFGALYFQPPQKDPRWRVSDHRQVSPKIKSNTIVEDPEDLNPEIVESVYRSKQ